nr:hypothetical protein CFP56_45527 [Quercus suber]
MSLRHCSKILWIAAIGGGTTFTLEGNLFGAYIRRCADQSIWISRCWWARQGRPVFGNHLFEWKTFGL